MNTLILGSSSPFRRSLLEKLDIPFTCHAPDIDETPRFDESPEHLVSRLARQKAEAVAHAHPEGLIITSDQVSVVEGKINGKPLTRARAIEQLEASSGNSVTFYTSLCLFDAKTATAQSDIVVFRVHFRDLSREEIERYIDRENPLNCAGSFKSEGYGVTLFKSLEGNDPNALIGLPLIRLCEMLRHHGFHLP